MEHIRADIEEEIHRVLKEKGMTVGELVDKIWTQDDTVRIMYRKIITGKEEPSLWQLSKIALALGVVPKFTFHNKE